MFNPYNNVPVENRPAWRSAYEIKKAAFEHEKRRFQMLHELGGLEEPQTPGNNKQQPGWQAVFRAPLRLLSILIG